MKIAIIGAGLSGSIASGAFKSYDCHVFESSELNRSGISKHKAVFRIHSEEIGRYLGCQLEKVRVRKQVYWNGRLHDNCTIDMLNNYSRKVYGYLGNRSIENLGNLDRWILCQDQINPRDANYRHSVLRISNIQKDGTFLQIEEKRSNGSLTDRSGYYDAIISTIPLPNILKLVGVSFPNIFDSEEIFVYRAKLSIGSKVHQTIYFPNQLTSVYRATIEGEDLIVESLGQCTDEIRPVISSFGLNLENVSGGIKGFTKTRYKYGKISCPNEEERKGLIRYLTEKHNIYSFGRYAIWKPIRADELIKDIKRIMGMISVSSKIKNYKLGLEEAG